MSDSHTWTRPRLLLALLVAALVAGAVPVRAPQSGGDKASGTAAWRAASARPLPPRPDVDPHGAPVLAAGAAEVRFAVTLLRADEAPAASPAAPPPAPARSPLPRAPPAA